MKTEVIKPGLYPVRETLPLNGHVMRHFFRKPVKAYKKAHPRKAQRPHQLIGLVMRFQITKQQPPGKPYRESDHKPKGEEQFGKKKTCD